MRKILMLALMTFATAQAVPAGKNVVTDTQVRLLAGVVPTGSCTFPAAGKFKTLDEALYFAGRGIVNAKPLYKEIPVGKNIFIYGAAKGLDDSLQEFRSVTSRYKTGGYYYTTLCFL